MSQNIVYPRYKGWKANGSSPASGYYLYTYESGTTTTPKTTYSDASLTIPNANPIVLDANGECIIFPSSGAYRFDLKTPAGTLVNTFDPITGPGTILSSVAKMVTLKALAAPDYGTTVVLLGYDTVGDGGGGTFWYDSSSTAADNGGTIIQPASLPATGRWKRIYVGPVNVMWFGAVKDSGANTTNSTTAFQNAIALGGDIEIPVGIFVIKATLNINKCRLIGQGAGSGGLGVDFKTYLLFTALTTNPAIQTTLSSNSDHSGLQNLVIAANSWDASTGCRSYGCDIEAPVQFENVEIYNFYKSGIFLHQKSGGGGPYNSVFKNVKSEYNKEHGCVVGTGANNLTFIECYWAYNGSPSYGVAPSAAGGSYDGFIIIRDGDGGSATYGSYVPEGVRVIGGNGFLNSRYGWNFNQVTNSILEPGYAESNLNTSPSVYQYYLGNDISNNYINIAVNGATGINNAANFYRRNNTLYVQGVQSGYGSGYSKEIWSLLNRHIWWGENVAQTVQAYSVYDDATDTFKIRTAGGTSSVQIGNDTYNFKAGVASVDIACASAAFSITSTNFSIATSTGSTYIGGYLGVGVAALNRVGIYTDRNDYAAGNQFGMVSYCTANLNASTYAAAIELRIATKAEAFTLGTGYGIRIASTSIGATSAITTLYGLRVDNQTGAGTNYAISTGTGRVNFGDVVDTVGRLGVGAVANTGAGIDNALADGKLTGNTTQYGIYNRPFCDSGATTTFYGYLSAVRGGAGTFTTVNAIAMGLTDITKGAGQTVTNSYGLYIANINQGAAIKTAIQTFLGDIAFFKQGSFGAGAEVIYIGNATTNPSTNPATGGILYSNAGAGTWRGSGGTVTAFGPAGPHCGECGYDAWKVACFNSKWKSWHYECGNCGHVYKGGPKSVLSKLTKQQGRELLADDMDFSDIKKLMAVA